MTVNLDPSRLPRHVAIIMDGNGRWARERGRDRTWGHHKGADAVREVVRASRELGIPVLTLYAFSEENWQRPPHEIGALMALLENYLESEKEEMMEQGIRFNAIGALHKLPPRIQEKIAEVLSATRENRDMILNLALSYGGRSEIVHAARALARKCMEGRVTPEEIDERVFADHLYTAGLPDPDLLIRTSGEQRVSNFLLWQISYAEFWVTPVLWPDFRKEHFLEAVAEFQRRQRRFGKTEDQLYGSDVNG